MSRSAPIRGFRITSLGTLASRLLGMARDVATAALWGMSAGGVMDAFVVAFRIPDLFRRFLGEGALTASYLPQLSRQLLDDRQAAWRLISQCLCLVIASAGAGVVIAELGLLVGNAWLGRRETPLSVGLTATLLPYVIFLCISAQLSSSLQALNRFALVSLGPVLVNVAWLLAVVGIAPRLDSAERQAYCLAGALLVAGGVQSWLLWTALRALGFSPRFARPWDWTALNRIGRSLLPTLLGLSATQLNTLLDSLVAWWLSREALATWLGMTPLAPGATAATYYGERLYMLPLGLIGVAVATASYPQLSRLAARGQTEAIGAQTIRGLRMILFLAVPASIGLALVARPLAEVLFVRGAFTAADAERSARVIAAYAPGIWIFCCLPLVARACYALGDERWPMRGGLLAVATNLLASVALVGWLREAGLAWATTLAAAVQLSLVGAALVRLLRNRVEAREWAQLGRCLVRVAATTALMAGCCRAMAALTQGSLETLLVTVAAGTASYAVANWLTRSPELPELLARPTSSADPEIEEPGPWT